jgi:hypothetical protein
MHISVYECDLAEVGQQEIGRREASAAISHSIENRVLCDEALLPDKTRAILVKLTDEMISFATARRMSAGW